MHPAVDVLVPTDQEDALSECEDAGKVEKTSPDDNYIPDYSTEDGQDHVWHGVDSIEKTVMS